MRNGKGIGDFGLGSPTQLPPLLFLLRLIWEQVRVFPHSGWGYCTSNGIPEAREAVARRKFQKHGVQLDPAANITFTMKGSRMIYPFLVKIILGIYGRTDVVLPLPFYPGHLSAIRMAGGKAVFILAFNAKEFVDRLEEKLHASWFNPAAVIVCSIGNPIGYRFGIEEFRRLVALAHKYGFKLVVDEAYAELGYDGTTTSSPFEVESSLPVTFVTMTGSKFLSAAAGGIGVGIGPANLISAFNSAVRDLSEGGNGMLQVAFGSVLSHCDASIARLARLYYDRALGYTELLKQRAGLVGAAAGIGDGGMFIYPPTGEINADELVRRAEAEGVSIRPGSMYMNTADEQTPANMNYLRLCLREDLSVAERSFAILGRIISEMKG